MGETTHEYSVNLFVYFSAGCAEGIDAWDLRSAAGEVTMDKFLPRLTEEERNIREEEKCTEQQFHSQ